MAKEKGLMYIDTNITINIEELPTLIIYDISELEKAFNDDNEADFLNIIEGMESSMRSFIREGSMDDFSYKQILRRYQINETN